MQLTELSISHHSSSTALHQALRKVNGCSYNLSANLTTAFE